MIMNPLVMTDQGNIWNNPPVMVDQGTNTSCILASLIELLGEVLDAEQNLFGKRVRSMENWLKKYLKEGFVLRYERRKEIASDETVDTVGTGRTAKPFVLTPTLVGCV